MNTIDPAEVAKFDRLARDWWNPEGSMKPLHRFNPVRLAYLRDLIAEHFGRDATGPRPLADLRLLDVGCGGGLLSEPLCRMGATVSGIDPATTNVEVAKLHAAKSGLAISYSAQTIEAVVASGARYDVVLAMEVVEHVADVTGFVAACAAAVEPGGLLVMATINRTLRSFALAIVGAEYVLRWLPPGTHAWDKFVTPDELKRAIKSGGLQVIDTQGTVFNPITQEWSRSRDTGVNYMVAAERRLQFGARVQRG